MTSIVCGVTKTHILIIPYRLLLMYCLTVNRMQDTFRHTAAYNALSSNVDPEGMEPRLSSKFAHVGEFE